jgi:hypothetical protein
MTYLFYGEFTPYYRHDPGLFLGQTTWRGGTNRKPVSIACDVFIPGMLTPAFWQSSQWWGRALRPANDA